VCENVETLRKRSEASRNVRKDCLVSESSSQVLGVFDVMCVNSLNGAKIFETSRKSFAFRENMFAECENRSHFFGSRVCTSVILFEGIGGNELRFQRLGRVADLSLRSDTGNPRVYFFIPVPVPVNTVPVRLRVWCYRGFLRVTRKFTGSLRTHRGWSNYYVLSSI
jgi:hypothetical protein